MKFINKKILNRYKLLIRKQIIWSIIISISFISFLSYEQSDNYNFSERTDSNAYITSSIQSVLEQNFNERNVRPKTSEKYNLSELFIFNSSQSFSAFFENQLLICSRSLDLILISPQNNHSLRSPPLSWFNFLIEAITEISFRVKKN